MNLDFFKKMPKNNRGKRTNKRMNLTREEISKLKKYGEEYFDGETGYGGYYYDGRWRPVAEEIISYYRLTEESKVLEVGCAKGFLMYEFYKLGITKVYGCDISSYAISHVPEELSANFKVMGADKLDYEDGIFDLVISIDCLHNLPSGGVDNAINEIMRVTSRHSYIRVGSYRTEQEYENIKKWAVTSLTFDSPEEWLARFKRLGYTGDYYFRCLADLDTD